MKAWYLSKTLWVNTLVAALVALEAGTGLLQPFLPPHFYAIVAVGLPIVNAVLRIVTTQGLSLGKPNA
jgi:hypothetical protein